MGDFLVDLRPPAGRQLSLAAEHLRFESRYRTSAWEQDDAGVAFSSNDDPGLWDPYQVPGEGSLVVLAGRIDLEESAWRRAEAEPGPGGLAARHIWACYQREGRSALEGLSGNFAVLVWDRPRRQLHVVSDPCGMLPLFVFDSGGHPVIATHPDALADVTGQRQEWDRVSLAEFVLAGRVTWPFTYYQRIRTMPLGSRFTYQLRSGERPGLDSSQYFEFTYQPRDGADPQRLVEELSTAFRRAVQRRTLPRMGPTVIALSGGLDSRTILCATTERRELLTLCCHNEINHEFRIAERIARTVGVPFLPFQRDFDYYGRTAEAGVRLSAGMGSLANNHFLGLADTLRERGIRNMLTGCYCDYLFKALPLNRRTSRLTGRERLAPFRHEYYFEHYQSSTPLAGQVQQRLEENCPRELRDSTDEGDVFRLEVLRTFPLAFEGDNSQRVVPQRSLGWYVPICDREVLEVYRRIPFGVKLDRRLFREVAISLCGPQVSAIPDANTGAPLDAGLLRERWSSLRLRVESKLAKLRPTVATQGSWLNWGYYIQTSPVIRELWERNQEASWPVLAEIVNPGDLRRRVADYQGADPFLMIHLLTVKLWLETRI